MVQGELRMNTVDVHWVLCLHVRAKPPPTPNARQRHVRLCPGRRAKGTKGAMDRRFPLALDRSRTAPHSGGQVQRGQGEGRAQTTSWTPREWTQSLMQREASEGQVATAS